MALEVLVSGLKRCLGLRVYLCLSVCYYLSVKDIFLRCCWGGVNRKPPPIRCLHEGWIIVVERRKHLFPLINKIIPRYKGMVVLGGELAVPSTRNPLYAGLNSPSRILSPICAALTGRRATDTHEPCQVRKEAAISDGVCVADRSRSICGVLKGKDSTRGCTTTSVIPLH